MRIAGLQYANGIPALRILFPRLESFFYMYPDFYNSSTAT